MENEKIDLDIWRYEFCALKLVLRIQELGAEEKRPISEKEKYALLNGAFNLDRAIAELKSLKKVLKREENNAN